MAVQSNGSDSDKGQRTVYFTNELCNYITDLLTFYYLVNLQTRILFICCRFYLNSIDKWTVVTF